MNAGEANGLDVAYFRPIPLSSLAGANSPQKGEEAIVYELKEASLEQSVHKGVYQALAQVPQRHHRVAIDDDEFFQSDKIRRIDQARKTFRTGTRPVFRGSFPERKGPLSTLLRPTTAFGPFEFRVLDDSSSTTADAASKTDPKQAADGAAPLPFPGSIPVSLMAADIEKIYDGEFFYVWSWKANGTRFLFVIGTFGGERLVMLINRARQIYVIPIAAPALLYDGTILDGELVAHADGRFSFLVYDAIMTGGVPCGEYNYLVRLQNASFLLIAAGWLKPETASASEQIKNGPLDQKAVAEQKAIAEQKAVIERKASTTGEALSACVSSVKMGGLPFAMSVKPVYGPTQMADVLESVLPALDYEIDGLVATPTELPVQMGQTDEMFKYKRGTDHTIDFLAVVRIVRANPSVASGMQVDGAGKTNELTCDVYDVDLLAVRDGRQRPSAEVAGGSGSNGSRWAHWTTVRLSPNQPWVAALQKRLAAADLDALAKAVEGRIVECRYDAQSESWHLEGIRADKTAPNKLSTAWKTWQNIRENLSLGDIFAERWIPEDVRARILRWERANPRWPSPTISASPAKALISPAKSVAYVPPPMAPVTLNRASQFR